MPNMSLVSPEVAAVTQGHVDTDASTGQRAAFLPRSPTPARTGTRPGRSVPRWGFTLARGTDSERMRLLLVSRPLPGKPHVLDSLSEAQVRRERWHRVSPPGTLVTSRGRSSCFQSCPRRTNPSDQRLSLGSRPPDTCLLWVVSVITEFSLTTDTKSKSLNSLLGHTLRKH